MKRILLFEADTTMANAMQKALQQENFNIYTVDGLDEGIRLLGGQSFDAAIVGTRRRHDDALKLIEFMNVYAVQTPVLVLTGADSAQTLGRIRSRGLRIARIINEPIQLMDLIETLYAMTGRRLAELPLSHPGKHSVLSGEGACGSVQPTSEKKTTRRRKVRGFAVAGFGAAVLLTVFFLSQFVWTASNSQAKDSTLENRMLASTPLASGNRRQKSVVKTVPAPVRDTDNVFAERLPRQLILILHGSNTIGARMIPEMVRSYMKSSLGASDVRMLKSKDGAETRVEGVADGKVLAVEIEAYGSSTGFTGLSEGKCDIAMASRPVKDKEVVLLEGLGNMRRVENEHIVALDGIAIIVHAANPIDRLRVDQAAAIFSGEITDWSELGGHPGPIQLYARDANSGTFETFKKLVLGNRMLAARAGRFHSNMDLSEAVSADPRGIGFTGLPYVNKNKALAVSENNASSIYPTFFTVGTEDYPLARRLFLYTAAIPTNPYVRDFIRFAMSSSGQDIVREVGFVDMTVKSLAYRPDTQGPAQNEAVRNGYFDMIKDARRLSTNFRFNRDDMDLDNRSLRDLDRVVAYLKQHLDKNICLIGFADSMGDYEYNRRLALNRVMTVKDAFLARGLQVSELFSAGEELPVASNLTAAGRRKNRRVEVWIQ